MFKIQARLIILTVFIVLITLAGVIITNIDKSIASIAAAINTLEKTNLLAQASGEADVNAIASATTVFISPNLENKAALAQAVKKGARFGEAGSGVIIAQKEDNDSLRKNFVHYVLTNAHVVAGAFADKDFFYGVRTLDGDVYQVTNIKFFGTPDANGIQGLDLAVVEFFSDCQYPVATITDTANVQKNSNVFVSGWPTPPQGSNISRKRELRNGIVIDLQAAKSNDTDSGYGLIYTVPVGVGLSGGPVFNQKGELVGIHGEQIDPNDANQGGKGIPVTYFIENKQENYNLNIAPPSVKPEVIAVGKQNMSRADILAVEEFLKLFDVQPTDEYFEAIRSLVERYGCLNAYPDGTFRPRQELTRGELAVQLNSCLNQIEKSIQITSENSVIKQEFQTSITSIQESINSLSQKIKSLQ